MDKVLESIPKKPKNLFWVNFFNVLKKNHDQSLPSSLSEGRQQKQEKLQSCSLWKKNHIHRKIKKMKRQRAIYQMKEQDETPEKQRNEVEIGNLPEKEFRIMIVKMIQDLGIRMEAKIKKNQEMFNRASLVAQWLRICLPMQGIRVRALVWEDPTCRRATRLVSHDYWACASGACAPQQERLR